MAPNLFFTKRRIIEWSIVLLVLAFFISILWPVQSKARNSARSTKCMRDLRDIGLAAIAFSQDHEGRLPGQDWVNDLRDSGIEYSQLACNSSSADRDKREISYGYNALLLVPGGKGIHLSQIQSPDKVGVICDADPVTTIGGLIGGSTDVHPISIPLVTPSNRHSGVIITLADGHARYMPGNYTPSTHDKNDPIYQAFYLAKKLGYIKGK